jgi:hypothetical protein
MSQSNKRIEPMTSSAITPAWQSSCGSLLDTAHPQH